MLGASVAIFALATSGLAGVYATYSGWDSRAEARAPRNTALYTEEPVRFLWDSTLDRAPNDLPVDVVFLDRATADAPLPPGLAQWPANGQVMISPRLADEMHLGTGDESRWGTVAGAIDAEGLLDPGERLVYVGATGLLDGTPSAVAASGYGTTRFSPPSLLLYRKPLALFYGITLSFAVAPAMWLLMTSLAVGGGARARRVRLLTLLGANRRQVRAVLWGEARLPWVVGAISALVVIASGFMWGLPLPGASFHVEARDLRSAFLAVAVAALVGLGGSALACRSRRSLTLPRSSRSRTSRQSRQSALIAWLPLVLASLSVVAQNVLVAAHRMEAVIAAVLVGSLVTLASVPAAMEQWGVRIGSRSRAEAWESGSAGQLTGAAQLADRPRPAARFAATCVILMVISTAIFTTLTTYSDEARNARALQAQLGDSIAIVTPFHQRSAEAWSAGLESLRTEYYVAALRVQNDGSEVLIGDSADLAGLGVATEGVEPAWASYISTVGGQPAILMGEITPDPTSQTTLVVGRRDGAPVALEPLRQMLAHVTAPGWFAEFPGDGWLGGARVDEDQARWVVWFGALALIISLMALWTNYTNELLRVVRSLLALQLMAPSAKFVRSVVGWRVLAPVVASIAAGAILATILSLPPDGGGNMNLPIGFVATCAAVISLSGVVAWLITVRSALSAARRFTLGAPDE